MFLASAQTHKPHSRTTFLLQPLLFSPALTLLLDSLLLLLVTICSLSPPI